MFKKFIEESLQNYEQSNSNRENDSKENNVTTNKSSDCDYYMSRLNQLLNKNKQVNDRYGMDNVQGGADVKSTAQNNNLATPEVRTEREVRRYFF